MPEDDLWAVPVDPHEPSGYQPPGYGESGFEQPPALGGPPVFGGPPPLGYPVYGAPQNYPQGPPYPPPTGYPTGYPAAPGYPPPGYGGPYGYLPPPVFYGSPSNGKATAGLVLGILAVVFCWTSFFDIVFVVLGLVFGLLGLGEAKKGLPGRGPALAGVICAAVGAIGAVVLTIVYINIGSSNDCSSQYPTGSTGYYYCIQNN
jgi:hypothetical protein